MQKKAKENDNVDQQTVLSPLSGPAEDSRAPTERGRLTIARILTNAFDIFTTEGYGDLSLRKISAKTNLSLSNIRNYFSSREEIIIEVFNTTYIEYISYFDEINSDATLSPEVRLEMLVRLLIAKNTQSKTQGFFVNLFALAQSEVFARQTVEEFYMFQIELIGQIVATLNPVLPPSALTRRSELILAQIEGLMVFVPQRNRFPSDLRGLEDDAVKTVLALANMP
ncbi:TetR/AcrR family transcriptional regulator [Burkholderia sp. YIM B11467]